MLQQPQRLNSKGERYVIGPTGAPMTLNDLPPANTQRWVIRRKAEVVAAVRGGNWTQWPCPAASRLKVRMKAPAPDAAAAVSQPRAGLGRMNSDARAWRRHAALTQLLLVECHLEWDLERNIDQASRRILQAHVSLLNDRLPVHDEHQRGFRRHRNRDLLLKVLFHLRLDRVLRPQRTFDVARQ